MPLRIVVDARFAAEAKRWLGPLRDRGDVELIPACYTEGEFPTVLRDADVVICVDLTKADTANASRLRLVQGVGAGVDRIDPSAVPAGATLCSAHGQEGAVAELAMLGMLALRRGLIRKDSELRAGRWNRPAPEDAPDEDLAGHTLGVLGLGHVGFRIAALGVALEMRVIGATRSPGAETRGSLAWVGGLDQLERLFAESDFVVVATALTPATVGMVGRRELELLGPSGFLVNVARGLIVDERALYDALHDRTIAGAALDVWYRYPAPGDGDTPPGNLPFGELENVIMTPHIGGLTRRGQESKWKYLTEQIERVLEGRALSGVVFSVPESAPGLFRR